MKKFAANAQKAILSAFFAAIFVSLFSCDVIDPPYLEDDIVVPTDSADKKVLLEDFTAHLCNNCPRAADQARAIKDLYGDRVVVVASHVGELAEPTVEHPEDFRTEAGGDVDDFFEISAIGLPRGMVDRAESGDKRVLSYGAWETAVAERVQEKAKLKIVLDAQYAEAINTIEIDVELEFVERVESNARLCLYVLEDSVIAYQKGKPDIEQYVHMHMLRAAPAGSWGIQIKDATIEAGEKIVKYFQYSIPVDADWKTKNLSVVAFVHDFDESYEVLQVEKTHVE